MVLTASVASHLKARAFLYSELAKFARAGFGIDKACESIIGQKGSDRTAREICRAILNGTRSGKSMADALAESRYPVSNLEVAMVDAAERGGKLELGFRHLAEHFRQDAEARRRIRRALVYPLVLLHFALLVGIGITALLRTVGAGLTGGDSADWRNARPPSMPWSSGCPWPDRSAAPEAWPVSARSSTFTCCRDSGWTSPGAGRATPPRVDS